MNNVANFRIEALKKMPEMVLRTIDHGVVHCCARCGLEIPKESAAVAGFSTTRSSICYNYKIYSYNRPKCPHCLYEDPNLDRIIDKAYIYSGYNLKLSPIPYNLYRKFEHVVKIKKTWWGRERIVDSVIEMIEIES